MIETKTLQAVVVKDSLDPETGSFEAILSHPDTDRDGEQVKAAEWNDLPARIPLNYDHNMAADGLVGSGEPYIQDGALHVKGTFASTPKAQEIRTLVMEGHLSTMSVEFLRKTDTDSKGIKTTSRELIGGAFTPYPAQPKAVILSAKAGARNSRADQEKLQTMHDHAVALGASCTPSKSVTIYADEGDVDTYTPPTRASVNVVIDGDKYILTYHVYENTGEIYPSSLVKYPEDTTTEDTTESADAAPDAASADDAKSLFEFQSTALLALVESYS